MKIYHPNIKHIVLIPMLIAFASGSFSPALAATDSKLEQRLAHIEKQLGINTAQQPSDHEFTLYGSLRPSLTHINNRGVNSVLMGGGGVGSQTSVGDTLSRIGLRGKIHISNQFNAIVEGNWRVEIAKNGQLGRARLAYAGLESKDYGTLTIGLQFPPQYLLIAEPVDIFDHTSSPFAYNQEGQFYLQNSIKYTIGMGPLTFMATGQFRGSNTTTTNNTDYTSGGIGYKNNGTTLAGGYVWETNAAKDIMRQWGVSASHTFRNTLYAAIAYQRKNTTFANGVASLQGNTLDTAIAYSITEKLKAKGGYFIFDDGKITTSVNPLYFTAYNFTLEEQLHSDFRIHVEYINQNYKYNLDSSSFTIGMRYDFSHTWY